MGKVFPFISTLKEKPELFQETIRLIEESFQYEAHNSFTRDFAPLVDESNHHNCFILIDEGEKVLSHIGVLERAITIEGTTFSVAMLGGIVVDKDSRGKGHFQTLMNEVMAEKRSDVSLFLLWSDNEKLYGKFGFYLCGNQYELTSSGGESDFVKTIYASLNEDEKKDIHSLYEGSFKKSYLTLNRDKRDWESISKISSADLYIERNNGKITSYFFMNKGQDLSEVIYEYGSIRTLKEFYSSMKGYGKIWSGVQLEEGSELQYSYFMAPGDTKLFAALVSAYSKNAVSVREINVMKQEVFFDFNQELYGLDVDEFLRGLFGPGVFEEIQDECRPFFISGLDSI